MSSTERAAGLPIEALPPADVLDAAAARHWSAWKARGVAHDAAVQKRFIAIAIAAVAAVVGALAGYGLLIP
jgi:hypothetical protein